MTAETAEAMWAVRVLRALLVYYFLQAQRYYISGTGARR